MLSTAKAVVAWWSYADHRYFITYSLHSGQDGHGGSIIIEFIHHTIGHNHSDLGTRNEFKN